MKIRWRVIVAVALGVWFALWLLRGDATPEARGTTAATEIRVSITRVHVALDGIEFYRINDGAGDAVLSVDKDLPLAAWLRAHSQGTLR